MRNLALTRAGWKRVRDELRRPQTGAAAALAGATLANNAIQLAFTVVFTRLLGAEGYGALAAMIAAFLILAIGGQAVQVAAAREATLGRLGRDGELGRTLRRWAQLLVLASAVSFAVCAALREPIAALLGVEDHPWAAASIVPTGALWLLLCLERGALQGLHAYTPVGASLVGEALGRIVCALALYGLGLGVTGAFLGAPLAFALTAVALGVLLHRRLGPAPAHVAARRTLAGLVSDNWAPILGLVLLAVLQNVDVIVARRELRGDLAGSYAASAVAARTVVWVAIGVGLQLLPEATRHASLGEDARPALLRALAVLAAIAAPALLMFALAPELVLRLAFGEDLTGASEALLLLGAAMTLLAFSYLTVQYLVALGEHRFLWVLGAMAVLEPFALAIGDPSPMGFASMVLGLQLVVAAVVVTLGLRASPAG